MVAWQFTAWNRFGKEPRPVRDGLSEPDRTSFPVFYDKKPRSLIRLSYGMGCRFGHIPGK
jgi:hypothetical protein